MLKKIVIIFIIFFAFFLRIYRINSFPPGLYSDEAAYAYNSYSLLKTTKDEYGKTFPLAFKSFGDYKPPLTAWLMIPSIAIFGLNEFAIRLPSALSGTLAVIFVYFLAAEIFRAKDNKKEKYFNLIPPISALLLAISPWHLHFSRSNMLVGLETMLTTGGVLFFLKGLKNPKLLLVSSLLFSASIYSYYGARVTTVLLVLSLFIIYFKKLLKLLKFVLLGFTVGIIFLSPLILSGIKDSQTFLGRTKTISIFFDPGIKGKLWEAHTLSGPTYPVILSRIFHNKPYFYMQDAFRRYLQHFSFDFLISSGDPHPPFDIPNMGQVYALEIPFFFYGLFLLIKKQNNEKNVLLACLLISPISAAFTFITPSANRAANFVIPFTIISALGLATFFGFIKRKKPRLMKPSVAVITLSFIAFFAYYLYQYYVSIPHKIPQSWHFGRKEMVAKVTKYENNFNKVVLTEREGPTYIWLLLYKKYDPRKYWQSAKVSKDPDYLGWLHVESFDKYYFVTDLEWEKTKKEPGVLYVAYKNQLPDSWEGKIESSDYKLLIDDKIFFPDGTIAYKLGHLENTRPK